jgi:DNA-binding GntR family transcriptional regulator
MTSAPLTVAPKPVGRHRVRDLLEGEILTGKRPPGSKLRQHELANDLGVAVHVIREALLELYGRGLIDMVDNRGAFVSRLTREKMLETFDIREGLEGIAARRCCERMNRIQIRALKDLAERIYECSKSGELEEANRLDRQLHDRLLHASGNSLMPRLVGQYRWVIKVVWSYHDPENTRLTHLAILEAIEENRPDDAERLMREHIRISRELTQQRLAEQPEDVHWIAQEE